MTVIFHHLQRAIQHFLHPSSLHPTGLYSSALIAANRTPNCLCPVVLGTQNLCEGVVEPAGGQKCNYSRKWKPLIFLIVCRFGL